MADYHERLTPGVGGAALHAEHVARYEYAARFVAGAAVLDAACGTGYGSRRLADAGAASVVGVDVSPEAVDHARRTYADDADGRVRFEVGDAQSLAGHADAAYDAVVSFETIEHLPDVAAYLAAVARVLRPGGRFLCSTPDRRLASPLHPLRRRPSNPFHVREFTRGQFVELLSAHFAVEEVVGQHYVGRWAAVRPAQVLLKGASKWSGPGGRVRRRVSSIYQFAADPAVVAPPRPGDVARFWLARCTKRVGPAETRA